MSDGLDGIEAQLRNMLERIDASIAAMRATRDELAVRLNLHRGIPKDDPDA